MFFVIGKELIFLNISFMFADFPKEVLNHTITLEPRYPLQDDDANFKCTVQLNSKVSRGYIKWYQGGSIIKATSPINDQGPMVQEEQSGDGYEYRSHLRIRDLKSYISGITH